MKATINYIRQRLSPAYPAQEIESFVRIIINQVCHLQIHEIWSGKDTQILPKERKWIEKIVEGLLKYQPIQYLLGETEFYGLRFIVNKQVLIPRPETEELVEWIVSDANTIPSSKELLILDIGTGSGCIAVSLAKHLPKAKVYGLDISAEALHIARQNAAINQVNVEWIRHDILNSSANDDLPQTFDIIVSNPPYVTPAEKVAMVQNVLDYEPHLALFTPPDQPLLFYDRIADFGNKHLREQGSVYFEINPLMSGKIVELLDQKGYYNVILRQDISGKDRMVRAES